jgi:hypothetical protein
MEPGEGAPEEVGESLGETVADDGAALVVLGDCFCSAAGLLPVHPVRASSAHATVAAAMRPPTTRVTATE